MKIEWARSLRDQCKEAGVPFFFKQLGNNATLEGVQWPARGKGGDFDDIPCDLRVREFPEGRQRREKVNEDKLDKEAMAVLATNAWLTGAQLADTLPRLSDEQLAETLPWLTGAQLSHVLARMTHEQLGRVLEWLTGAQIDRALARMTHEQLGRVLEWLTGAQLADTLPRLSDEQLADTLAWLTGAQLADTLPRLTDEQLAKLGISVTAVSHLYSQMLAGIRDESRKLDQSTFGPREVENICNTPMCIAGHTVNLANAYPLAKRFGFAAAATLIHRKSRPDIAPPRYDEYPNEWALAYIEKHAAEEKSERQTG